MRARKERINFCKNIKNFCDREFNCSTFIHKNKAEGMPEYEVVIYSYDGEWIIPLDRYNKQFYVYHRHKMSQGKMQNKDFHIHLISENFLKCLFEAYSHDFYKYKNHRFASKSEYLEWQNNCLKLNSK